MFRYILLNFFYNFFAWNIAFWQIMNKHIIRLTTIMITLLIVRVSLPCPTLIRSYFRVNVQIFLLRMILLPKRCVSLFMIFPRNIRNLNIIFHSKMHERENSDLVTLATNVNRPCVNNVVGRLVSLQTRLYKDI